MSRPTVLRRVGRHSRSRGFRPIGRHRSQAGAIGIALDELEAIRLADLEGLYQDAAAGRMGISRQTYARILARARHAVAVSLLESRTLLVGPGPVIQDQEATTACPVHGGPRRHGRTCHCPGRCAACGRNCPHPGAACACRAHRPAAGTDRRR